MAGARGGIPLIVVVLCSAAYGEDAEQGESSRDAREAEPLKKRRRKEEDECPPSASFRYRPGKSFIGYQKLSFDFEATHATDFRTEHKDHAPCMRTANGNEQWHGKRYKPVVTRIKGEFKKSASLAAFLKTKHKLEQLKLNKGRKLGGKARKANQMPQQKHDRKADVQGQSQNVNIEGFPAFSSVPEEALDENDMLEGLNCSLIKSPQTPSALIIRDFQAFMGWSYPKHATYVANCDFMLNGRCTYWCAADDSETVTHLSKGGCLVNGQRTFIYWCERWKMWNMLLESMICQGYTGSAQLNDCYTILDFNPSTSNPKDGPWQYNNPMDWKYWNSDDMRWNYVADAGVVDYDISCSFMGKIAWGTPYKPAFQYDWDTGKCVDNTAVKPSAAAAPAARALRKPRTLSLTDSTPYEKMTVDGATQCFYFTEAAISRYDLDMNAAWTDWWNNLEVDEGVDKIEMIRNGTVYGSLTGPNATFVVESMRGSGTFPSGSVCTPADPCYREAFELIPDDDGEHFWGGAARHTTEACADSLHLAVYLHEITDPGVQLPGEYPDETYNPSCQCWLSDGIVLIPGAGQVSTSMCQRVNAYVNADGCASCTAEVAVCVTAATSAPTAAPTAPTGAPTGTPTTKGPTSAPATGPPTQSVGPPALVSVNTGSGYETMTGTLVEGTSVAWLDTMHIHHLPANVIGAHAYELKTSGMSNPVLIPTGSSIKVTCQSGVCDVYLYQFHKPPLSTATNGVLPLSLPSEGWIAASCAPQFSYDSQPDCKYPFIAYRIQIAQGDAPTIVDIGGDIGAKYLAVFVKAGVECRSEATSTECAALGGYCQYHDDACVDMWCPRLHQSGSGGGKGGKGSGGKGKAVAPQQSTCPDMPPDPSSE